MRHPLSLFFTFLCTVSFAQTSFQTFPITEITGYSYRAIAPADYDNDGDIDLLAGDIFASNNGFSSSVLLKNNGGKDFSLVRIPLGSAEDLEWVDIDNDNDLDFIATTCYQQCVTTLLINEGNDTFREVVTGMVGTGNVSTSDFNNDGRIDVALRRDNQFYFYQNLGNYTFIPIITSNIDYSVDLAWTDFNNDGLGDFASGKNLYQNNGDGTFTSIDLGFVNNGGSTYLWADLDNDNDVDFVRHGSSYIYDPSSGQTTYSNIIKVYENQSGTFVDKGTLPGLVSMSTPPLSADFDHDGDVDIIINGTATSSQYAPYSTRIYWNTGNFTFTSENINDGLNYRYIFKAADIDNDLDPDLIASSTFLSTQRGLENQSTPTGSRPTAPTLLSVSQSSDQITLTWSAATDTESSTLTYNLYVKRNNEFFITPNANIGKGWSMLPGYANAGRLLQRVMDTSSWPEGYYTWGVQALDNEMNASPFSSESHFEIKRNIPSIAPTDLIVSGITGSAASLQWTDNSSHENSFFIERSSTSGNSGFQIIGTTPANVSWYTDNTVKDGLVYYYRVRISDSAAVSNVVQAKIPVALPGVPSNLILTSSNTNRISIKWDYTPTDNDAFVVERSKSDPDHFAPIATVAASDKSFIDTDLPSGTVYFYRVYATSALGRSTTSDELKASTTEQLFAKKSLASYAYEFGGNNISWADFNNDGFDDVFIPYKSQLLKNNGDGTFSTVQGHGISLDGPLSYYPISVWGDYDSDGYTDIFVANGNGINWIFKNNGNETFKVINSPVTSDFGYIRHASWADIDNDGDLELMACGDYYQAYFRYDGDGVFTKVDLPKSDVLNNLKFASWGDVDDDGYVDAYLGMSGPDQLMMNKAGILTPVSSPLLAGSDYASDFAIWCDFNNDLKLDLTTLNESDYIYASTPGGYERKISFDWYPGSPGGNTSWVDFDNDGDLDFFSWAGTSTTWFYENTGQGNLVRKLSTPLNGAIGNYNSISWVDYNNDGFIDGMPLGTNDNIYENTPNGNGWVRLRLRGQQSNSKGLGARVFVKANGKWQRRDIHTGHSGQVQQGFDVIVGLGGATKIDSIQVKWPSGARQYLLNQEINQVIVLNEADAQVKSFGKPSNLRGIFSTLSSIQLVWQDNSIDEDGFIIQRTTDGLTFTDVATVPANQTAFTVSNLSIDADYSFRVMARKGSMISAPTNVFIGTIDFFKETFAGSLSRGTSETSGASWMDFTGDGKPDVYASGRGFEGDALYQNIGNDLFSSKAMITPESFKLSRSGAWGDYNNDGFPDLFLSVGGGSFTSPEYMNDQLWKNENGVMARQTGDIVTKDETGTYHASWGDLNKDGFLDLVVGTSPITKYVNLGGQSFSKVPTGILADSYRVVLSDIDNDNDLDLVTGLSKYLNNGGEFALPQGYQSTSQTNFAIEDFDEDGQLELLTAGLGYYKYNIASGSFVQQPNPFPGLITTGYVDVNVADLDNNGHLDVLAIRNGKPELYLNEGNMTFEKFSSRTFRSINLGAGSSAIADYNGDGTLDILFSPATSTSKVLVKTFKTDHHWIRIRLKGVQSPRDGIGAKIKVIQKDAFQMREIRSSRGSFSANEQIAHFGLGTRSAIEYLKIEWPSGSVQWIKNPPIDGLLVVEERNIEGPEIPAPTDLMATLSGDSKISLTWTDAWDMEQGFIVERAIGSDANFTVIARLPANTVTFDDPTEHSTTVRYRVRTYFDNRSSTASNTAEVLITSIESHGDGIELHPNPATDRVIIRSAAPIKSIQLFDSRGIQVVRENPGANATEHVLHTHSTTPGIYMVRLELTTGVFTRKLIITR